VTRAALAVAVAVAACRSPAAAPVVALSNQAPPVVDSAAGAVPIAQIRGIADAGYPNARRDCRPSIALRRYFAGAVLHPCGSLDYDARNKARASDMTAVAADLEPLLACAEQSIAANRPFITEQRAAGIDSGGADAIVGVREHGALAVYVSDFDDNPCGGGCPEKGQNLIMRCENPRRDRSSDCYTFLQCFHCDTKTVVDLCVFGKR
jgi:hypothetical protein